MVDEHGEHCVIFQYDRFPLAAIQCRVFGPQVTSSELAHIPSVSPGAWVSTDSIFGMEFLSDPG